MKRLITVVVGLSIALLSTVAFCQDTTGIPEEIIKQLDDFVGTWKSDGDVGGKKQTGGFTCRWYRAEDKRKCCIVGHFSLQTGDVTKSGITLMGWNAAQKCIEDRGFDANGGNGRLLWTMKSPTEWHGESVFVENGKEVKSKGVLIKKGSSEIVMESKSETGEVARFVFTKVKEEGEQKTKR